MELSLNTTEMTCLLSRLYPRIDVAKQDLDGPVYRFTDLLSDWYSTLSAHVWPCCTLCVKVESCVQYCHLHCFNRAGGPRAKKAEPFQ